MCAQVQARGTGRAGQPLQIVFGAGADGETVVVETVDLYDVMQRAHVEQGQVRAAAALQGQGLVCVTRLSGTRAGVVCSSDVGASGVAPKHANVPNVARAGGMRAGRCLECLQRFVRTGPR